MPWEDTNLNNKEPMTQTKLFENRKKDKIPDISYDLDRDGYVGGKDYVISKRFDKDKDGKLNEVEKKAAYDAIHNHVEEDYVWGLDNQGITRPCRILQKVSI